MRQYPDATFTDVTAPNADTLYSIAFFDVGKEPWVLSLPDMKDRYALFPMLDGWTDVFQVPGKRTTGTAAQTYAITGPGWSGPLPAGVKEFKSPTSLVWLLGRIYCTGTPEDYAAVHALQDEIKLVPLSSYGKPYTPPPGVVDPKIDMKTPVREQVNRMDTVEYFTLLAELMKTNPPAPAPRDAVYPTSPKDAEGREYDGANKYVVHFPEGQLPPTQGFWSITMYNAKLFFVANPINRYSISARQDLKRNADGSADLTSSMTCPARTRRRTGSLRPQASSS